MYTPPPQQPPPMFPPCPEYRGRHVRVLLGRDCWMADIPNVSMTALRLLICSACGHSSLHVADLSGFQRSLQQHPDRSLS